MNGQAHPRQRTVRVGSQDGDGRAFEVILHANDRKLRSHAVKHFADAVEFAGVWRVFSGVPAHTVQTYIDGVREVGCPFLAGRCGVTSPPCADCVRYDACSPSAQPLEAAYLGAVERIFRAAADVPRCAVFAAGGGEHLWAVPDRAIVGKARTLPQSGVFNLSTCLVPTPLRSVWEVIDNAQRRARNEAEGQAVAWYTEETWGLGGRASSGAGAWSSRGQRKRERDSGKDRRGGRKGRRR